jgi:hypothetical protein
MRRHPLMAQARKTPCRRPMARLNQRRSCILVFITITLNIYYNFIILCNDERLSVSPLPTIRILLIQTISELLINTNCTHIAIIIISIWFIIIKCVHRLPQVFKCKYYMENVYTCNAWYPGVKIILDFLFNVVHMMICLKVTKIRPFHQKGLTL